MSGDCCCAIGEFELVIVVGDIGVRGDGGPYRVVDVIGDSGIEGGRGLVGDP
jgi:hypothetical protein